MKKKSTYKLIESLYGVVLDNQNEMRRGFQEMNLRFDRLEKISNGHENRISNLEDSNRTIKTHLKLS